MNDIISYYSVRSGVDKVVKDHTNIFEVVSGNMHFLICKEDNNYLLHVDMYMEVDLGDYLALDIRKCSFEMAFPNHTKLIQYIDLMLDHMEPELKTWGV